MLLTVEGGGFFSSSASGYSKGLALLLLGKKTKDKPMKVTPWSHYPPLDEQQQQQRRGSHSQSEAQLAPAQESKGLVSGGCASLSCFGCAAAGLDSPSSRKSGPKKSQELLHETPSSFDDESQDRKHSVNPVNDSVIEGDGEKMVGVQSDLERSINGAAADICPDGFTGDVIENSIGGNNNKEMSSLSSSESENSAALDAENGEQRRNVEKHGNASACQVQGRKVQWMDAIGGELFEIREFEMSDDSDDEFGHNGKCTCVIM